MSHVQTAGVMACLEHYLFVYIYLLMTILERAFIHFFHFYFVFVFPILHFHVGYN